MYHLFCDGLRITTKCLTLKAIIEKFGPVYKLEQSGIRLVKIN